MDGSTVNKLTSGNQDATASADKGTPNRRTVLVLDSLLGSDSMDSDNDINDEDVRNQMISNEVLMYFGEQHLSLSKTESPLSWWKLNEARFPALASLAISFLCITATSTPSEQLFSELGTSPRKREPASLQSMSICSRFYIAF